MGTGGSSPGAVRTVLLIGVMIAVGVGGGVTAYVLTREDGGSPTDPGAEAPPAEQDTGVTAPPIPEARVEGTFSGKGFYGAELTFTPECPSGPCDVTAEGERPEVVLAARQGSPPVPFGQHTRETPVLFVEKRPSIDTSIDFIFRGPEYEGRDEFESLCIVEGLDVPVTVTYSFEVIAAEMIDGVWQATELVVTSELRSSRGTLAEPFFTFTCLPFRDAEVERVKLVA
jgi:hypothetical protein